MMMFFVIFGVVFICSFGLALALSNKYPGSGNEDINEEDNT